jgi:hypothetical protein
MDARTGAEVERGYGLLAAAHGDADRVMAAAALILSIFEPSSTGTRAMR